MRYTYKCSKCNGPVTSNSNTQEVQMLNGDKIQSRGLGTWNCKRDGKVAVRRELRKATAEEAA